MNSPHIYYILMKKLNRYNAFRNEKLFFPQEHIFGKEILCWMYLKECGPIFILHNKSQAVS